MSKDNNPVSHVEDGLEKLEEPIKPKRGRPRADKTGTQVENSRVHLEKSRIEAAHSPNRPPRVPMGATLKLEFGSIVDDSNYKFRVFSDRDGRISQAKQGWWEHVKDDRGDNIVRHVGPNAQYLMKIEKKYWEEDQELKQSKLSDTIKKEQILERDEYLPDGRHHVLQKDDYNPLQ